MTDKFVDTAYSGCQITSLMDNVLTIVSKSIKLSVVDALALRILTNSSRALSVWAIDSSNICRSFVMMRNFRKQISLVADKWLSTGHVKGVLPYSIKMSIKDFNSMSKRFLQLFYCSANSRKVFLENYLSSGELLIARLTFQPREQHTNSFVSFIAFLSQHIATPSSSVEEM